MVWFEGRWSIIDQNDPPSFPPSLKLRRTGKLQKDHASKAMVELNNRYRDKKMIVVFEEYYEEGKGA
jgi:hypothetical protein